MESEAFTEGGKWRYNYGTSAPWSVEDQTEAKRDWLANHAAYRDVAIYKTAHAFKWLCRAIFVVCLVYVIIHLVELPLGIAAFAKWFKTKHFTQKENLQWLGASTNVVRGDYENNQDSLAEIALKGESESTDMPTVAPKQTFVSRERMTPEQMEQERMRRGE